VDDQPAIPREALRAEVAAALGTTASAGRSLGIEITSIHVRLNGRTEVFSADTIPAEDAQPPRASSARPTDRARLG
jgi:hypothetical protein